MARKSESNGERVTRALLKQRHDAELEAYATYFAVVDRRAVLLAKLQSLDAEQTNAVGQIAASSDVGRTSELVGWPTARVRDAVKAFQVRTGSGEGVETAAEVA